MYLTCVTPRENPKAKCLWNQNQSKGEIKFKKPVYFLQAVTPSLSWAGCSGRGRELYPNSPVQINPRPSYWYVDRLIISTPWKHLLICRCPKTRGEIVKILQFYPQHDCIPFQYIDDAGVLVHEAEEWASQILKVGEQSTGFYLEITWENRAPGSRQEGTREPVVVCCLGGFTGSWGFFENIKKT